jgi:hypothetical protein
VLTGINANWSVEQVLGGKYGLEFQKLRTLLVAQLVANLNQENPKQNMPNMNKQNNNNNNNNNQSINSNPSLFHFHSTKSNCNN